MLHSSFDKLRMNGGRGAALTPDKLRMNGGRRGAALTPLILGVAFVIRQAQDEWGRRGPP